MIKFWILACKCKRPGHSISKQNWSDTQEASLCCSEISLKSILNWWLKVWSEDLCLCKLLWSAPNLRIQRWSHSFCLKKVCK